jgi:hypothetical protein
MEEHFQQSLQLWPLLVLAARNRQTLTYEMVQTATGIYRRNQGMPLGHIYCYCKSKGLPLLNLLVVVKNTGVPSEKPTPFEGLNMPKLHAVAFNFPWDKWEQYAPTLGALKEARKKYGPEKAAA